MEGSFLVQKYGFKRTITFSGDVFFGSVSTIFLWIGVTILYRIAIVLPRISSIYISKLSKCAITRYVKCVIFLSGFRI